MSNATRLCSIGFLAAIVVIGCGHDKTVVHRETVQMLPPPIVEKRTTTVETEPLPPVIQEHTTVRSGSVERHTTTIDEN